MLKKWALILAAAWLGAVAVCTPAPAVSVGAAAYCLLDAASGQVLAGQAAHEARPVASTTKMMTAILADEYLDYAAIALVSEHADHTPEYTIGLRAGQQVAVGEVMKAALIRSSNDAAVVLAEQLTGDEAFFAELMTKKAFALGAVHTNFKNASGLPAGDHYSSAYDLAVIGRELLRHPRLAALVATPETTFLHPAYQQPLTIRNTNQLLHTYDGADGIKTGTTNAAGPCLVASATRDGRRLIAVSLHAGDRNAACRRLLDYGFAGEKIKLNSAGDPVSTIWVKNSRQSAAAIVLGEDIFLWRGSEDPAIEKKLYLNYELEAPLIAGQVVGRMEIWAQDTYLGSYTLISGEDAPRQRWWERMRR